MTEPVLLTARESNVLVLTLNRPAAANALDVALHDALVRELAAAAVEVEVRAVVLGAAGERIFCAGADVKEFSDLEPAVAMRRRRSLLLRSLFALVEFEKPLVTAVQGKALGAGCMLALLGDEVVAVASAEFGLPEIRLGMPSPMGAAVLMARGGRAAAQALLQIGDPITALRALSLSLIDEAVEPTELRARSMQRAVALAASAGPAYAGNKRWLNGGLRATLGSAAAEADRLQDEMQSKKDRTNAA
jgi:enoyl-CoA hydratase/carnithine racemase